MLDVHDPATLLTSVMEGGRDQPALKHVRERLFLL